MAVSPPQSGLDGELRWDGDGDEDWGQEKKC